VYSQHNHLIT